MKNQVKAIWAMPIWKQHISKSGFPYSLFYSFNVIIHFWNPPEFSKTLRCAICICDNGCIATNGCTDNDNDDSHCNCHNGHKVKQCQRATIPKLMVDLTP